MDFLKILLAFYFRFLKNLKLLFSIIFSHYLPIKLFLKFSENLPCFLKFPNNFSNIIKNSSPLGISQENILILLKYRRIFLKHFQKFYQISKNVSAQNLNDIMFSKNLGHIKLKTQILVKLFRNFTSNHEF